MAHINWKDVIIGLLVAYVAIDLLLAYAVGGKHQGLFNSISTSSKEENGCLVIVIGLAIGFFAWYLSSKVRECFTPIPQMK